MHITLHGLLHKELGSMFEGLGVTWIPSFLAHLKPFYKPCQVDLRYKGKKRERGRLWLSFSRYYKNFENSRSLTVNLTLFSNYFCLLRPEAIGHVSHTSVASLASLFITIVNYNFTGVKYRLTDDHKNSSLKTVKSCNFE